MDTEQIANRLADLRRALFMRYIGKRAPEGGWPAGDYEGRATLVRDDIMISEITANVAIVP